MQRDVRVYLEDVRLACELLESFAEGKTFHDYVADPMLRSAVERQFLIIGEAVGQMVRGFPETESRVTDARKVSDFRNQLMHGYRSISDAVVWSILVTHLPQLKREIIVLLAELDDQT